MKSSPKNRNNLCVDRSPVTLDAGFQFYHFFQYLRQGPYSPQAYESFNFIGNIFELFSSAFSVIIFFICIKKLLTYQKRLLNLYSDTELSNLSWALRFLYAGLGIAMCWFVVSLVNIFRGYFIKPLALFTWLSITALIYWTGASLLFKTSLLSRLPALSDMDIVTLSPKAPPGRQACEKIEKSLHHVLTEQQPFLEPDLTLRALAKQIGTTDKKLSAHLNQHLRVNFSDFINAQRVEAFKNKVQQGALEHYSIIGLAKTCGFKSKSSFYRSFKKAEGTTPSDYFKKLSKKAS
jgi:AraC-like DNA-binding protein